MMIGSFPAEEASQARPRKAKPEEAWRLSAGKEDTVIANGVSRTDVALVLWSAKKTLRNQAERRLSTLYLRRVTAGADVALVLWSERERTSGTTFSSASQIMFIFRVVF